MIQKSKTRLSSIIMKGRRLASLIVAILMVTSWLGEVGAQVPGKEHASGQGVAENRAYPKFSWDRIPLYDLSNPKLRDWWVGTCSGMTADPAIDGVFLDGNIKVLEPGYLRRQIGAKRKQEMVAGYHLMMKQTRAAIGPDKLMIANILRARFSEAGLEYMDYFDGSYLEGFHHKVGGASYEEYVAKGIDAMQRASRDGKIVAFTSSPVRSENQSEQGIDEAHATVQSDEQARAALIYPLAIYLIAADTRGAFNMPASRLILENALAKYGGRNPSGEANP